MKERPILFSGPMVKAILDGRKTQTRRVVKPGHAIHWLDTGFAPTYVADSENDLCPYGHAGDRLWVRETWGYFDPRWGGEEWVPDRPFRSVFEEKFGKGYVAGNVIWAADGHFAWCKEDSFEEVSCWKPSIHMPRWASRITLEVTSVRLERLNDISETDAKAEGLDGLVGAGLPTDALSRFWNLWESINGPGSWASNPWVWAIEFRRIP